MGNIVKGDNGTVLEILLTSNGSAVDLRGATVTVNFKQGSRTFIKIAKITDGITGTCEVTLDSNDVAEAGIYMFQAKALFSNGNSHSSDIQRFSVGEAL